MQETANTGSAAEEKHEATFPALKHKVNRSVCHRFAVVTSVTGFTGSSIVRPAHVPAFIYQDE